MHALYFGGFKLSNELSALSGSSSVTNFSQFGIQPQLGISYLNTDLSNLKILLTAKHGLFQTLKVRFLKLLDSMTSE